MSIVSEMITPGILILATGSLVNTTLFRLSRTVDRARILIDLVRQHTIAGDMARAHVAMRWLNAYARRVRLLEHAMTVEYISLFLFVASTLIIAVNEAAGNMFTWLAPSAVILGAGCLFYSAANLTIEAQVAAGTVRSEINEAFIELAAVDPTAQAPEL